MENINSEVMFAGHAINGSLCNFLEQMDEEEKASQQQRDMQKAQEITARESGAGGAVVGAGGTVATYMGCHQFSVMKDKPGYAMVAALVVGVASYFFAKSVAPDSSKHIVEKGHKDLNAERYARLKDKVVKINHEVENNNPSSADKLQLNRAKTFFDSTIKERERFAELRVN